MSPEIMIESFLKVLKNRSDLFSENATEGLKTLEDTIVKAENESNQVISNIISDWCRNYREITEAVKAATKSKPQPKASQHQGDENIVENQATRFPKMLESLEKRIKSNSQES